MNYQTAVLPYRSYKFLVHDFLESLGYQKTNYYKIKHFESLSKVLPYVQYFSDYS